MSLKALRTKQGKTDLAGKLADITMRRDMILKKLDLGKAVAAQGTHVLLFLLREVGLHVQGQVLLSIELLPAFLKERSRTNQKLEINAHFCL
jgi:hypothetical protein